MSPRLFSCNYICIDHLGAFEDVWVGVEADRRGPGKGGWGRGRGRGGVAGRVCGRYGWKDVLHRVFLMDWEGSQ